MTWLSCGSVAYQLRQGDTIIGSGADADWQVSHADLMPRHFVATLSGDRVQVSRFTQESVIVVGDVQVLEPRQLSDGEIIAAGTGRFVFTEDAPRIAEAEVGTSETAYLVEERAGTAHPLDHRSTSIGRDASNSIVIRNPTASRFHAEIRREAGGFALHSMGSAGSVLNGRLMKEPAILREGDLVEIAFTIFEYTEQALPPGVEIVTSHSTVNDESTRKPTLATEWVIDEDGERGDSASPVWVILGLLWFFLFSALAWYHLRR